MVARFFLRHFFWAQFYFKTVFRGPPKARSGAFCPILLLRNVAKPLHTLARLVILVLKVSV